MAEQYLTTREAAAIFRVTPVTIISWIRQKRIRAVRVGATWRIPEREIKRLLVEDIGELSSELTGV